MPITESLELIKSELEGGRTTRDSELFRNLPEVQGHLVLTYWILTQGIIKQLTGNTTNQSKKKKSPKGSEG